MYSILVVSKINFFTHSGWFIIRIWFIIIKFVGGIHDGIIHLFINNCFSSISGCSVIWISPFVLVIVRFLVWFFEIIRMCDFGVIRSPFGSESGFLISSWTLRIPIDVEIKWPTLWIEQEILVSICYFSSEKLNFYSNVLYT